MSNEEERAGSHNPPQAPADRRVKRSWQMVAGTTLAQIPERLLGLQRVLLQETKEARLAQAGLLD